MANFWKIVNQVISDADILLLVLDSREVIKSKNKEVETKVFATGKPLIYVITKSDLGNKMDRWKGILKPCVFISSKEFHGIKILRDRILIEAKRIGIEKPKVGVLGYPNVGKSSLINAVKGKGSAGTSSQSGHTRGLQKVSARKIVFLDTPGVIPHKEKNVLLHAKIGITDFTKVKNPDLIVMDLMEEYPGKIEDYYGCGIHQDKELAIDAIGKKRNLLKSGGNVDVNRTSRTILRDWQRGNIH